MAESTGDKTEAPTPRRRQEAREQGNIPRSADLTSAVLLISSLFLMKWFGLKLMETLRDTVQVMLSRSSLADLVPQNVGPLAIHLFVSVAMAMLPMLGGVAVFIILVNIAQTGLNFNPGRLAWNLGALNPTRGFSKIFGGGQGMVSLLMSIFKVALVGLVAYSAIGNRLGTIVAVQELSLLQIFLLGSDMVFSIGLRVGILLLILAIVDYLYQRYRIEKTLKMTKQEVKDEMRSMDGDPVMKNRRRQVAQQRHMQRLKKEVPTADVVVTNPTHFAVALKYTEGKMRAPKLVAKGADLMAFRIRQLASEAGVPIVERPTVARAIYRMVDVGEEIPEELYSAVAEILAYVYELTRKTRRPLAV